MTTILHDRPADAGQYALWAEATIDPSISGGGYFVATFRGVLDEHHLEAAARAVLERHEPLRSVLRLVRGQLRQCVLPALEACSFERATIPCEDGSESAAVREWCKQREQDKRWDLATEAPIRFQLLTHAPNRCSMVFEAHHAGFDGRSKFIVARDFSNYLGKLRIGHQVNPTPLAAPSTPVATEAVTAEAIEFWRTAIDKRMPLTLPEGGRLGQRSIAASPTIELEPSAVAALRAIAQNLQVSTFTMLFAALTRQMTAYDNIDPVLSVASDVSDEHTGHVAGLQTNVVPVSIETSRQMATEKSVASARRALTHLARYRRVPFVDLVSGVPGRPLARLSTELGLSFPRPPAQLDLEIPGLRSEWEFFTPNTNAALARTLQIRARWPQCRVRLDYRQDLMGAAEAEIFLADFRTAVTDLASDRETSLVSSTSKVRPRAAGAGTPYICAGVRAGTLCNDDAPHPPRLMPSDGVRFTVRGRSEQLLPCCIAGTIWVHLADGREVCTDDCGYVAADGEMRHLGPREGRWIRTRSLIDASAVARVARTHTWVREAEVQLVRGRTDTAVLSVSGPTRNVPSAREIRAHLRTFLHASDLPGRIKITCTDTLPTNKDDNERTL
ncbi:condensation domain-containing protein [Rhodococcoides fascians]|uniref:condensation domain-containing protein n=1 Tax=Rhodococcoides fascians TaxID=1828 RepID=UPI000568494F|nr:condensation domain-containing protein [Rhodococcus fascians]